MTRAILDVQQVSFRYRGARTPLFDEFTLSVRPGELVAALGPSGCGKSTLLYLLGLFLRPDRGRIAVDGCDTERLGDGQRSQLRAHRIGFVFQDAALHLGETIEDNVAEGALYSGAGYEQARTRARFLLDAYGILDIAARRPTEISAGQAQRAALCRALIRRPSLLLADEPTGNLDADNAAAVMEGLRAVATGGGGVVVVTHSRAVADASDRVIRLA